VKTCAGIGFQDFADQIEVHDLVRRTDHRLLGRRRAQADHNGEDAGAVDTDRDDVADLRRHRAGKAGAILRHVEHHTGARSFDRRDLAEGNELSGRTVHERLPAPVASGE
jgi:hypothetical protein